MASGNIHEWTNSKGYTQRHCLKCRRRTDRERYADKPRRRERVGAAWAAYKERASAEQYI